MVYIPPGGLQIDAVLQPYDPPEGDAANFELVSHDFGLDDET